MDLNVRREFQPVQISHLFQNFKKAGRLQIKLKAWSVGLPAFAQYVNEIAYAKVRLAPRFIRLLFLFYLRRQ